ncbi:MAG TPA: hypothetical protein VHL80_20265 [Polyangia bacterium]|nr:hypothetical protein [Polyangia bacterium]
MQRGGLWGVSLVLLSGLVVLGCGSGGGSQTTGAGTGDTGGSGTGSAGTGGSSVMMGGAYVVTVDAASNHVTLDGCGFSPAQIASVPAGTYTVSLTASTLTKGGVSGPGSPSTDNYVIVHVPFAAGDPNEDHRFFMLNGVGASASITLSQAMTIDAMFIDSDVASNSGTATVTVTPGNMTMTVSGTTNDLAYDANCHSTPAMQVVTGGMFRVTLLDSSFSSGGGAHDDFILVRTPDEQQVDDHRYVILNGDGASQDFTPFNSQTVRLWYIGAGAGTGVAHVQIAPL